MRTILFAFLMVFSTQAVAFEIMMRCETKVDFPVNIYKYIQEGENKQVLRRLDAEWVAWCQKRPTTAEQKAIGWGEVNTSLKITEKGAVCSQVVPYTPKQTTIENMLLEGGNYIFQRETILDFEFFTRAIKTKMENLDEGVQPSKYAPQYFTCVKIQSSEASKPSINTPKAKSSNPEFSQKIEPSSFIVEVKKCWVVDIASPAANVTLKVGFQLKADGKVKAGSIRLLEHNAKKNSWAKTAFQAARRAIIRCQKGGFNIPEGFDTSTQLTLEFNPETMR